MSMCVPECVCVCVCMECIFECLNKRHIVCLLPRCCCGSVARGMYLQAATSFIANGILIELTCRVNEQRLGVNSCESDG